MTQMAQSGHLFKSFLRAVLSCFALLNFICLQPRTGSAFHHAPTFSLRSPSHKNELEASSLEESTSSENGKNVVVVGAGVGGLAVASRIASSITGRVTIIEKNSFVGGRCGSFETTIPKVGTFRHERGPSLLLLPDVYRDIFHECSGSKTEDFGLHILPCVPAYQIVFEDGDSIEVGFPRDPNSVMSSGERKSREKMNSYETEGAAKWDEYMRATSAFLDCGLPNFIEERLDLSSFPSFLVEALRDFGKAWPLKPHSDVLDAIFESEKMKAMASFQDLYVGLEPYRNNEVLGGGVLKSTAPAVFGLLAAIELHPSNRKSGVFAPQGGFQVTSNALERLARQKGVEIMCKKTVTHVQNDGVYMCDTQKPNSPPEFLPADLIVVNADLPYATNSLLTDNATISDHSIFDWDDKFTYSSGVISFHWSVGLSLDELNTHNVFMIAASRSNAESSWNILRTNEGDVDQTTLFNFYVHRASKTDPTAAPSGCDSIMVLVPCKTLLRDPDCAKLPRDEAIRLYKEQFSEEVVSKAREAVLKRLSALDSLKNLESHILDEVVDTPASWADQFHLAAGTPFALSHGFGQLSLTRPSPESSQHPNVLFCGASTRPGNGVPLVLIGAKQVAEKAVRRLSRQEEPQNES